MQRKVPKNVKQVDFKGRRQGGRRKRGRRTSKITYGMMARKVMSDLNYVKGMLNVEDKYKNSIASAQAISDTWGVNILNNLSLGNTSTTRQGQSIKAVDLQFNITASMNASAQVTFLRFIILRDEQPNAAAPAIGDVLEDSTNIRSLRNVSYNERFHIYYDDIVALNINGMQAWVTSKLLRIQFHTLFNTSNNGTIADITKNSLYFCLASSETTNTPSVGWYMRFSFIDN